MLTTFAIVLGLGLAVAFTANANNPVEKTESEMSTLHWFSPGAGAYLRDNTIEDEMDATGCNLQVPGCEEGYTTSQLVNPTDPSQGVKSNEDPTSVIGQE